MKRLIPLSLALLMGADNCETPPPPSNAYCGGATEGTFLQGLAEYAPQQLEELNTIIGGELSTDRRSTVHVFFGSSYCTGVVIGPRTVLTAAHCGYADTTVHRIRVNPGDALIEETGHLVHPEYWEYVNGTNYAGRSSDLMLIYFGQDLPGPYVQGAYDSRNVQLCDGLIAQGYGQDEFPETGAQLRESSYMVWREDEKSIRTKQRTWGGICFGDSGGPLYAVVRGQPGLQVAGITSTTSSQDCLQGSTHVKVHHFWTSWIAPNFNGPA